MKKTSWLFFLILGFRAEIPAMTEATAAQWLTQIADFQDRSAEYKPARIHSPIFFQRKKIERPQHRVEEEDVRPLWGRYMRWGLAVMGSAILLTTLASLTVIIPLFILAGLVALFGLALFGIGVYKWLRAGKIKSIALTALLLGLLGLAPYAGLFIGPIAVLFAAVALRKMRLEQNYRWDALAKFALAAAIAGIVLGMVLLLIF